LHGLGHHLHPCTSSWPGLSLPYARTAPVRRDHLGLSIVRPQFRPAIEVSHAHQGRKKVIPVRVVTLDTHTPLTPAKAGVQMPRSAGNTPGAQSAPTFSRPGA